MGKTWLVCHKNVPKPNMCNSDTETEHIRYKLAEQVDQYLKNPNDSLL